MTFCHQARIVQKTGEAMKARYGTTYTVGSIAQTLCIIPFLPTTKNGQECFHNTNQNVSATDCRSCRWLVNRLDVWCSEYTHINCDWTAWHITKFGWIYATQSRYRTNCIGIHWWTESDVERIAKSSLFVVGRNWNLIRLFVIVLRKKNHITKLHSKNICSMLNAHHSG